LITLVVGPFSRTDGPMLKRLGARHIPNRPLPPDFPRKYRIPEEKPGSGPARNVFGDSLHLLNFYPYAIVKNPANSPCPNGMETLQSSNCFSDEGSASLSLFFFVASVLFEF